MSKSCLEHFLAINNTKYAFVCQSVRSLINLRTVIGKRESTRQIYSAVKQILQGNSQMKMISYKMCPSTSY